MAPSRRWSGSATRTTATICPADAERDGRVDQPPEQRPAPARGEALPARQRGGDLGTIAVILQRGQRRPRPPRSRPARRRRAGSPLRAGGRAGRARRPSRPSRRSPARPRVLRRRARSGPGARTDRTRTPSTISVSICRRTSTSVTAIDTAMSPSDTRTSLVLMSSFTGLSPGGAADEAVADAAHGLDVGAHVTQLLAQALDVGVDGAGDVLLAGAPHVVEQRAPRLDPVASFVKGADQLELERGQRDLLRRRPTPGGPRRRWSADRTGSGPARPAARRPARPPAARRPAGAAAARAR